LTARWLIGGRWAQAYFGFLYLRFVPSLWFWEIVELARKVAMIFITTWGTKLSPLRQVDSIATNRRPMPSSLVIVIAIGCPLLQCFWAMNSVLFVLVLELACHPFQLGLHDSLEEYSSFVECV
jgi:hypothetical protein